MNLPKPEILKRSECGCVLIRCQAPRCRKMKWVPRMVLAKKGENRGLYCSKRCSARGIAFLRRQRTMQYCVGCRVVRVYRTPWEIKQNRGGFHSPECRLKNFKKYFRRRKAQLEKEQLDHGPQMLWCSSCRNVTEHLCQGKDLICSGCSSRAVVPTVTKLMAMNESEGIPLPRI